MLTFKKLKYKNFLSVGDNGVEIDLDGAPSTLIVGNNGVGKSIILDALSFALFGKPHRNITKPQLINSVNCKGTTVEIFFKVGANEYHILRGIKPNIFEIWCNDKLVNQESHSRDYQKLLETNILKLNHKSFHQIVVLGSGNFTPFMQLSASGRREVIEELLDIGIFGKMNAVLKENQSKLKDDIKDTEYQIQHAKDLLQVQHKHLDKLRELNNHNTAKYDSEIADLRAQISSLSQTNLELSTRYGENYGKTQSTLERNNKTLSNLKLYEKQISDNIKKIQRDENFYLSNDVCPTCHQGIAPDLKTNKLSECSHKTVELQNGINLLQQNISSTTTALYEAQTTLQGLMKLNHDVQSNQTLIQKFEQRIQELHSLKDNCDSATQLEHAQAELESLRESRDLSNQKRIQQLEERAYNETVSELLKDSGIKTKIIRQYLPVMNKLINQYLQMLDFFVSFELDENFSETIRSRYRDDFSYASFSEGEKSRINLSLLFAWRHVAAMKNSANTNLLILDEVFDSSMDSDGVDNLLKIMATLGSETNIFVITHKPDSFEGVFDRKITATKRGNFTAYETQELK